MKHFQRYLASYYAVGSGFPIRGAKYIEEGEYIVSCQGRDVACLSELWGGTWSTVLESGGAFRDVNLLLFESTSIAGSRKLSSKTVPSMQHLLTV